MYIIRLRHDYNMKAKHIRFNNKLAWYGLGPYRVSRPVSYFQVNFGEDVHVTGLATQRFKNFNSFFVKTYKVKFSCNGGPWFDYSGPNEDRAYFNSESSRVLLTTLVSMKIRRPSGILASPLRGRGKTVTQTVIQS